MKRLAMIAAPIAIFLVLAIYNAAQPPNVEPIRDTKYPYSVARKSRDYLSGVEREFMANNPGDWRIETDPYTGLIRSLRSLNFDDVSALPDETQSRKILTEFLHKNRRFFGLQGRFNLEKDTDEALGHTYRVKPYQTIGDVEVLPVDLERGEVLDARYRDRIRLLYSSEANRYVQGPHLELYVYGWYRYPGVDFRATPSISEEDAVAALKDGLPEASVESTSVRTLEGLLGRLSSRSLEFEPVCLVVLPAADKSGDHLEFRLCWQVEIYEEGIPRKLGGVYSAFVDAVLGDIVNIRQNFVE